jgi:hypothetical protein
MTQQRIVDRTQRRAELVIAILFLATVAASIPAAFVLDPILNAPDYLAKDFPNKGAVALFASGKPTLGWVYAIVAVLNKVLLVL